MSRLPDPFQPNDCLRENLMDALLLAAYEDQSPETESDYQKRIAGVLEKIDSERVDGQAPLNAPQSDSGVQAVSIKNRSLRWRRWISWSIAAAALLMAVFAIQFVAPPNQALAAIDRSLQAAQAMVTRHYRLTVTKQDLQGNERVVSSDLYVNGKEKFALRHPSPLRPDSYFWLGSDGQESWMIPVLGPIRVGDETGLGRWVKQRETLSTPILQVETLLARMKRGYRLMRHPNTPLVLDNGNTIQCQHIVGIRHSLTRRDAPDTISLWGDIDTGIAVRLEVTRDNATESGRAEKVTFSYLNSMDVPENWFHYTGHASPRRRIQRFEF